MKRSPKHKPAVTVADDKGAPAVAARLEKHERDAEAEIMRVKESIEALRSVEKMNGTDEFSTEIAAQVGALQNQLVVAYDLWFKCAKQVREYYKAVDESKREGEKIPRAEMEAILTSVWRFQRIGRETFIVSIAQDSVRCVDEQDFYRRYAEGIRDCERQSLTSGIEHGKFPAWVAECYAKSL